MAVRVSGSEEMSFVNATGLADSEIMPALRETAAEIITWHRKVKQTPSMFDRVGYDIPDSPYDSFLIAENAVRSDDVVGGLADVTEALAFQGVKWESSNTDDADVYNQISADLDLDAQLRVVWREMFTYSQVVVAEWWSQKSYQIRSPAIGNSRKRRKRYNIQAPTDWMVLDSSRIVPVGSRLFSNDPIAWAATEEEFETWSEGVDPLLNRFFPMKYTPTTEEEIVRLGEWGSFLLILGMSTGTPLPSLSTSRSQTYGSQTCSRF